MAWQTPKTTWISADAPIKDDFNRIEGNIQELENTKETLAGAQKKANTAETNAKNYANSIKPTKLSQLQNDSGFITVQRAISDSVSTVSSIIAASLTAVKTAYDKAVAALNKANLNSTQMAELTEKTTLERTRKITFGTADPNPANMEEGEVYLQYE